jgi:hypothetical protein
MGYWIVLSMLVLALAAVLVAIVLDGRFSFGRGSESRPGEESPRWLALTRSDGDRSIWAQQLVDLAPVGSARMFEVPGLPLGDLGPLVVSAAADHDVDVAAFWLALDDVLAGVPLEDHERALDSLLANLDTSGATSVVGNVPDLSRLRLATETGLPSDELTLLTNRWNGAIARLAYHHGALVVDLFDIDISGAAEATRPSGLDVAEPAFMAAVAERFAPVLKNAFASAAERREHASDSEPL